MINTSLIIGDVEPFSIVDFPNHIAVVVFLQGCPWRCPFCYNQSLQPVLKENPTDWSEEKFFNLLARRKGLSDAVVFSGGEPLMQDQALINALKKSKELGLTTGLHTGGYRPEVLKKALPFLDWVGLDVKGPEQKYKNLTGGFNAFNDMKQSLELLRLSHISFECRTTCDPRELEIKDLFELGTFLKESGVKEYYLQKYRPTEKDQTTTDNACESLISDGKLLSFLKSSFEKFDIRK